METRYSLHEATERYVEAVLDEIHKSNRITRYRALVAQKEFDARLTDSEASRHKIFLNVENK